MTARGREAAMLSPRCDDQDDWSDGPDGPPCDRAPSRLRDWAAFVSACAPVIVAVLRHGPEFFAFFVDRLREPPLPPPATPEPPPPPLRPKRRRKASP